MKNFLIKIDTYGGDADIYYKGFVILNEVENTAFLNILPKWSKQIFDEEGLIHIHVDCDDYLSIQKTSVQDFIDIFDVTEINQEQLLVLTSLFSENYQRRVSYGHSEPFDCVWESDMMFKKYPHFFE